ncbi:phosphatases II [Daedalea quercina L-15889]|uniref:Phosphatases II n=1 Tax=Daedalea quercina L-15889 TaxID=1314783 RepID=A0A165TD74_9APHY|nr:phosphatases II [Daedalea quercina L-15889]
MAAQSSSIPEWLKHANSPPHFLAVIRALSERERTRAIARIASRQRSDSGYKSQHHPCAPAHILSSLLHKTDNVEHYSVSVGSSRDLQERNRYVDIMPYDRTRVVISSRGVERGGSSGPDRRYLNANWVRELAGGKWWIASQAPLPNTAHAFLSVLLAPIVPPPAPRGKAQTAKTSRVRTVVQLTQNIEGGMRKAHVYFPDVEGEQWVVPPEEGHAASLLKVTLQRSSYVDDAKCVVSRVSVEPLGGQSVIFQHLLYASWPDHGVPTDEDRASLLRFARFVDETNRDLSVQPDRDELDPDPPIIVNCSAGIGRTGSFIALSSLLRKYGFLPPPASSLLLDEGEWNLRPSPLGPLPEELREDLVAQEIDMLREQRTGMVQKEGQVAFIYEMLTTALEEREAT